MTGFGRGEATAEGVSWVVEVSSVNRKQLEVVANLPRELIEHEPAVRAAVSAVASRGRVNVSVRSNSSAQGSSSTLRTDTALARQYASALGTLASALDIDPSFTLADAMRWPGVLELERGSIDADSAWPLIERALGEAVKQFIVSRAAEGQHLLADIEARLAKIAALAASIAAQSKLVPAGLYKAMLQRLTDSGLPVDLGDERLVKELAIYADRCDISEEVTRANAHLAQFAHYLAGSDALGRHMDFLTQELFREFNTMGSKANNAELAHMVVTAKSEIEKVREQVQNVE